ncbi:YidH family protein [Novosphingobium panipatense]
MTTDRPEGAAKGQRPDRATLPQLPEVPSQGPHEADDPAVELSRYRSRLSHLRTGLSEHRTDLSEFRTDLSQHRTELSDHRTEMSMRRTGMSFHRTRMSADRTLMSEMRTSLSLIGFGFTIYQAFEKLHEADVIHQSSAPETSEWS